MTPNVLYVMIGIPGSGKTTIAKNSVGCVHISRDEIRFSLLSESDNYFKKENQVYKTFIKQINDNLAAGKNVIADATHINQKSRNKLFHNLHIDRSKTIVIAIYVNTPLDICLERNDTRKGGRTFVPPHEIHNMYIRREPPTYNEPFDYIYTFNGKDMKLLERK